MQSRDFCFWLQGLLEAGKITSLDAEQVEIVRQHLDLVFVHDPNVKQLVHPKVVPNHPKDWDQWPHPTTGDGPFDWRTTTAIC